MARKGQGAEQGGQPLPRSWRMRIVGEGEVPPDQLLANPANFKIHGTFQKETLAGILGDIGWVQRIIVNRRTNCVLDGHARVQVALQHNEPLVPVVWVDVSEDEERLLLASLDTITGLAGTDTELLASLLHETSTPNAALMQMLSDLAAEHNLYTVLGGESPNDVNEHYQGMPAFEQSDQSGWKSLIVHFECKEDFAAFAALVSQPMTEQTKYIWYPYRAKDNLKEYSV